MKSKNLYVYLGNCDENYKLFEHSSNTFESYHLVDQDIRGSKEDCSSKENRKVINFQSDDIQDIVMNFMPTSNIIIYPVLQSLLSNDHKTELAKILRKVFLVTKMIYLPIIRHRKSKVWFLDESLLLADHCQLPASISLFSMRAGLTIFVKVAALELAKKNINVNLIRITEATSHEKLESLLLEVEKNKQFYVTAQELSI